MMSTDIIFSIIFYASLFSFKDQIVSNIDWVEEEKEAKGEIQSIQRMDIDATTIIIRFPGEQ